MSIKIIFTIINIISIAMLLTVSIRIREKEGYIESIRRLMVSAAIAVFANVLLANVTSLLLANIAFFLYFACLDWIIFYLSCFLIEYTQKNRVLKIFKPITRICCVVDTIILLSNLIAPKIYTVYSEPGYIGETYMHYIPNTLYYVHLVYDYVIVLIGIVIFMSALIKSYDFYRIKYVSVIMVVALIIVLNVIYMMFTMPLDFSVLFYAVAGILIYYYAALFVPRHIKNNTFGLVSNYMSEGLVIFDLDNNCIFVNETAEKELGIRIDNTKILTEIFLNEANKRGTTDIKSFTQTYTHEGDTKSYYRVHFKEVSDKKGRSLGSFYILENITEEHIAYKKMEEAEAEAERANRAKSMFLANMSHEIRTPINAVLGMNEMILRESTNEKILDYSQNIDSAGNALLSLINDILDFSKIEAGKLEIVDGEYSFQQVINECFFMLSPKAKQKDLNFTVKVDENIPCKLLGDKNRVQQILVNIISNAIKYTREGSVCVNAYFEDASEDVIRLFIEVKDTGIGISKENAKKLFNAFVRVDQDKNRNIEGTGLGLAITKQLAGMMHGDISVESEAGEGSKFTVCIEQGVIDKTPGGAYNAKPQNMKQRYEKTFTAPNANILVVDDVKLNIKVVTSLLKDTLVKIDAVESGADAVVACSKKKYDLILMDHMMPVQDGIETFKIIRAGDTINKLTPQIILTANAISGVEDEYKSIGFDDYLSKPVKSADLEKMIIKYLPKELIET